MSNDRWTNESWIAYLGRAIERSNAGPSRDLLLRQLDAATFKQGEIDLARAKTRKAVNGGWADDDGNVWPTQA